MTALEDLAVLSLIELESINKRSPARSRHSNFSDAINDAILRGAIPRPPRIKGGKRPLVGLGGQPQKPTAPLQPTPLPVNNGTFTFSGFGNTVTPPLPSGRVNGNFLLAWCRQSGTGTATISTPSGWQFGGADNNGAQRPSIFCFAYVTGSEIAPVFNSSASSFYDAVVLQFSGTLPVNPIGNFTHNNDVASPLQFAAITSQAGNSLAVNIVEAAGGVGIPSPPSGWTSIASSATGAIQISDISMGAAGSSVGPTSVPYVTSNYSGFTLEIRAN